MYQCIVSKSTMYVPRHCVCVYCVKFDYVCSQIHVYECIKVPVRLQFSPNTCVCVYFVKIDYVCSQTLCMRVLSQNLLCMFSDTCVCVYCVKIDYVCCQTCVYVCID